jgi:hypothetical protein
MGLSECNMGLHDACGCLSLNALLFVVMALVFVCTCDQVV